MNSNLELSFSLPEKGTYPWVTADSSYAGWIPNVMGHLAFSMIGTQSASPKFHCFNGSSDDYLRRSILVHQHRTVQDYLIKGELLRFFRPQVAQDFFLIARTDLAKTPYVNDDVGESIDTQGSLIGTILIIPKEKNKIKKKCRDSLVKNLINKCKSDGGNENSLVEYVKSQYEDSRTHGVSVLRVNFALFRTGEVRLWFDMDQLLGRQVHEGALVPSDEERALAKALPAQVYYFIKDAAHQHYHHEPESDQMLPLTKMAPASTDCEHLNNEICWRRETLWGLARIVSQYRRNRRLYDFKKAQGILAYADAFQSTLAKIIRPKSPKMTHIKNKESTLYDFTHTKASVEAMESLKTWKRSGYLQLFATMFGVFLSSIALWSGAVQIYPDLCQKKKASTIQCVDIAGPNTIEVVRWVAGHPLIFSSLLFIFGLIIFTVIIRDITFIFLGKWAKLIISKISLAVAASTAKKYSDFVGWITSLVLLAVVFLFLVYGAVQVINVMLNN